MLAPDPLGPRSHCGAVAGACLSLLSLAGGPLDTLPRPLVSPNGPLLCILRVGSWKTIVATAQGPKGAQTLCGRGPLAVAGGCFLPWDSHQPQDLTARPDTE